MVFFVVSTGTRYSMAAIIKEIFITKRNWIAFVIQHFSMILLKALVNLLYYNSIHIISNIKGECWLKKCPSPQSPQLEGSPFSLARTMHGAIVVCCYEVIFLSFLEEMACCWLSAYPLVNKSSGRRRAPVSKFPTIVKWKELFDGAVGVRWCVVFGQTKSRRRL